MKGIEVIIDMNKVKTKIDTLTKTATYYWISDKGYYFRSNFLGCKRISKKEYESI